MALYSYTALNQEGAEVRGELEASNETAVRRQLQGDGVFITKISNKEGSSLLKQIQAVKGMSAKEVLQIEIGKARVSYIELVLFTRQFSTLVGAGIPVLQSLDTLILQTTDRGMSRILKKIRQDVNEGLSFADSLKKHTVFSDFYTSMVVAAEISGRLGAVMEELADLLEERQELNSELRQALTYPAFMLVIGLGVVVFLLTAVVPNILSMFADTGQALPGATQLMLSISAFLENWGIVLLGLGAITFFVSRSSIQKNKKVEHKWDSFCLSLPIIGKLSHKTAHARFAGTLAALLHSGVPIITALRITRDVTPFIPYKNALKGAIEQVGEGESLADSLSNSSKGSKAKLPDMMINMISVGEKSGKLESMLQKVAKTYRNELKNSLKGLTSLVQPILLLFMGGLIAFIMGAVLLPIFELNTMAGGL
jgi:general secretion pathway protein F